MYTPRDGDATYQQIAQPIYNHIMSGSIIFLKWTCPKCGERVTSSQPLQLIDHPEFPGQRKVVAFPPGYTHDEKDDGSPCGELVSIHTYRFNYAIIMGSGNLDWLKGL